jgi:hypothetical protein
LSSHEQHKRNERNTNQQLARTTARSVLARTAFIQLWQFQDPAEWKHEEKQDLL